MNRHLTTSQIEEKIYAAGAVVNIGQISPQDARRLDKAAKAGKLVKYRGFWSTMSPFHGFGPLKSIWALPEFAKAMGVEA